MPNNTVNFALPYPAPTDQPCDFAQQWCGFTDAINTVLARFQAGIDRANPVIPAAMLRISTPHNVLNGNPIPFDEVVFDTAAMTNLDADPYHITITRTGRYCVCAFLDKNTSGVVNSQIGLVFQHELLSPQGALDVTANALDRGAGTVYRLVAYSPSQQLVADDRVNIFFQTGTLGAQQVNSAWMAVIWVADTEVP